MNELVAPVDLTINLQLPPIDRHRSSVRRDLRDVHLRFERGDWKSGFEDACKLVEKIARKYLRQEARGTLQVPGRGGVPRRLTEDDIEGLPMGALADVFCRKLSPNQIDALLCGGLKRINPDRILVAHNKLNAATERRLRRDVPRHMWTIDNMLRKLPG